MHLLLTRRTRTTPGWEHEWLEADALDREEHRRAVGDRLGGRRHVAAIGGAAVLAGLAPAVLPLTPGFSVGETFAAVVAATVAAAVAVAIVPLTQFARDRPSSGARDQLLFAVALLSAGAAAIHFAVAKMHFDEYALFGVFFVGSGIAQLVWPIWLLLRPWRPLVVLGALGNALIAALWAVDRIWGLPLGPEHWEPEPVGFGDGAVSAFELLLVAGCVALRVRRRDRPLRGATAAALVLVVTTVVALSLLSVLGVESSVLTPTE